MNDAPERIGLVQNGIGGFAQRKTVFDIAQMLDVEPHRIIFALSQLGLTAPGMKL